MRRRSRGVDRLLGQLGDPSPEVRQAAIMVLGRLQLDWDRPPRPAARQIDQVFRALTTLLRRDPAAPVRLEVAYALTFWFEVRAPTALLPVLEDAAEAANIRGQAAEGIGNVLNGGLADSPGARSLRARAIPALRQGLADPAVEVRFWCTYALGTMKATEAREELERMATGDEALCPSMWRVCHEARDALTFWETGRWPHRQLPAARDG
jgi:HEAT repeat protein